jgi:hypothetical protein
MAPKADGVEKGIEIHHQETLHAPRTQNTQEII